MSVRVRVRVRVCACASARAMQCAIITVCLFIQISQPAAKACFSVAPTSPALAGEWRRVEVSVASNEDTVPVLTRRNQPHAIITINGTTTVRIELHRNTTTTQRAECHRLATSAQNVISARVSPTAPITPLTVPTALVRAHSSESSPILS